MRSLTRSTFATVSLLTVISLSACSPSGDAVACSTFERGYNRLADAVRTGSSAASVTEAAGKLVLSIELALDSATGDVEAALRESLDASAELQQQDAQPVRFFDSAQAVASACDASGTAIDLHSLVTN